MIVLMFFVFTKVVAMVKNAYWGEEPSYEAPTRKKRMRKRCRKGRRRRGTNILLLYGTNKSTKTNEIKLEFGIIVHS